MSTPPAALEVAESSPGVTACDAPACGAVPRRRWPPLSLAVVAVPALIAIVRLLLAARHPFVFAGDEAILEASVRHVGDQLVGPYSRFGFNQPGPAYYHLQAPFYWLLGRSGAALFVGAACINLGAALGCVLVVRRFLGEPAARWSGAVIGALLLSLGPALLTNPWNPYVLALPVLFTAVLAAAAATGSPAAAGGAAVTGSYVVQTHLAAGAALLAMFATAAAVGAGLHLLGRRRQRDLNQTAAPVRARRRDVLAAGAAAALVFLMWTPPLVEEATGAPGNLSKLVRFFRTAHPEFDRGIDHGLQRTVGHVAAELTVMPFGHDREARRTNRMRILVAAGGLLVASTVAVLGWRRRRPVVAVLGAVSVVGPLAAVWSGTRIVGEVLPYLLVWTSALLLPAAIGGGVLLFTRRRTLVAVAAVGIGLSLTWTMARHPLVPYPPSGDVGAAARLARPWLTENRARQVRIRIAEHDRWPLATGLAVHLEKRGLKATVDQEWTFLFGKHFGPTGHETAEVWVAAATGQPPETAKLTRLGTAGTASVWAGPVSAR